MKENLYQGLSGFCGVSHALHVSQRRDGAVIQHIHTLCHIYTADIPAILLKKKASAAASASKGFLASKGFKAGLVVAITVIIFGLLFLGSYQSPIYGCNACHNTYRGIRMGVPPPTFKDRKVNPILSDNEWMMRHWYYPDVTW